MKLVKKGFTLIELLVVIGVLAVLMAGVVALINPQDKIRQANDSKVQSDVGQLATALQSAAAQNPTGTYPAALVNLGPGAGNLGELQTIPTQPTGAAYTYNGGGTEAVVVCGSLQSQKYNATQFWAWRSATGQAGPVAACPAP